MSIEALYPSRRHPSAANPLLRRAQRRHRLIVAFALVTCAVAMAGLRDFPNEASAAGRAATSPHHAPVVAAPARHIRVIPLYHIPPEQAGVLSYGN